MQEIHIFVSGTMQGVGFRAIVKRYALPHDQGFCHPLDLCKILIFSYLQNYVAQDVQLPFSSKIS